MPTATVKDGKDDVVAVKSDVDSVAVAEGAVAASHGGSAAAVAEPYAVAASMDTQIPLPEPGADAEEAPLLTMPTATVVDGNDDGAAVKSDVNSVAVVEGSAAAAVAEAYAVAASMNAQIPPPEPGADAEEAPLLIMPTVTVVDGNDDGAAVKSDVNSVAASEGAAVAEANAVAASMDTQIPLPEPGADAEEAPLLIMPTATVVDGNDDGAAVKSDVNSVAVVINAAAKSDADSLVVADGAAVKSDIDSVSVDDGVEAASHGAAAAAAAAVAEAYAVAVSVDAQIPPPQPAADTDETAAAFAVTAAVEAKFSAKPPRKKKRMCKFPGCVRVVKAQGHCQRHGAKTKRCKAPGCVSQAQGSHEGYCKRHWRELAAPEEQRNSSRPRKKKREDPTICHPVGFSVYDSIVPASFGWKTGGGGSGLRTPKKEMKRDGMLGGMAELGNMADIKKDMLKAKEEDHTEVIPILQHLLENDHLDVGWHRANERLARGICPPSSNSTQLESWEKQLSVLEMALIAGTNTKKLTHKRVTKILAHAWGREKGFHKLMLEKHCSRRGDLDRKKRVDAGKPMTAEKKAAYKVKLRAVLSKKRRVEVLPSQQEALAQNEHVAENRELPVPGVGGMVAWQDEENSEEEVQVFPIHRMEEVQMEDAQVEEVQMEDAQVEEVQMEDAQVEEVQDEEIREEEIPEENTGEEEILEEKIREEEILAEKIREEEIREEEMQAGETADEEAVEEEIQAEEPPPIEEPSFEV